MPTERQIVAAERKALMRLLSDVPLRASVETLAAFAGTLSDSRFRPHGELREGMAFLYDKRTVISTGLVCEIAFNGTIVSP